MAGLWQTLARTRIPGLNYLADHHGQVSPSSCTFLFTGCGGLYTSAAVPVVVTKLMSLQHAVMTLSDAVRSYLVVLRYNCNSYTATRSPCSLEILHRTRSQLAERSWYERRFRRDSTHFLIYMVALDLRHYMHTR